MKDSWKKFGIEALKVGGGFLLGFGAKTAFDAWRDRDDDDNDEVFVEDLPAIDDGVAPDPDED